MKKIKIGIQLYTLREALKADFKGTLRGLAGLGFDGVEFAGDTGGMEPDELAAFLRECGLATCGLHASAAELADPDNRVYDYARALGPRYVTFSRWGEYPALLDDCIAECRAAGAVAARKNLRLTYHNHACEFGRRDGRPCLEIIYDAMDTAAVMGEPDVCWIAKGGADPVAWIRRYADRTPQIHLKDMDASGKFTALGDGAVPLAACVEAARGSVCEWLIYEQDDGTRPGLESPAVSMAYLRNLIGQ